MRVELSLVSPRHPVDEEVLRDHALTLLRVWALRCRDHLQSVDREVELLEGMAARGGASGGGEAATPTEPEGARRPMKPVVITKEMLKVGVRWGAWSDLS